MPSRLFSLFGLSALFGLAAAAVQTSNGVNYVEVATGLNPLWDYISLTRSQCNTLALGNGQTRSPNNHDDAPFSIKWVDNGWAAYKSQRYCKVNVEEAKQIPVGCVKRITDGKIYWGFAYEAGRLNQDECLDYSFVINTNDVFAGLAQPPPSAAAADPTAEDMLAFIQQEQGCTSP